jgi:hypothetical protein
MVQNLTYIVGKSYNIYNIRPYYRISVTLSIISTKRKMNCTSISLPLRMVRYLDSIRDPDIPRSRFLFRLIERAVKMEEESKDKTNG